jgi:hypothetical protein
MMVRTLFIAIITVVLFMCAGCTDTGSQSSGGGASTGDYSEDLTYSISSDPVLHYRSDGTCYYRVDTVDVINNGAANAENVMVRCKLVDPSTGTVSDTASKYFELIEAGDHQGFSVELDGECGKEYDLKVQITREEK